MEADGDRVSFCSTTLVKDIEKVGFGVWWRRLLEFLSRTDGGELS